MSEHDRHLVYESGGWALDLARRELRTRGVPVPLGNRALQIFGVLVQSAGKLVTKDELMARVWPGAIVEENKLQVHVSAIRKALATDRGTLKTSFGRGYRVVGDWAIRKESSPADPVALDPRRTPVRPFHPFRKLPPPYARLSCGHSFRSLIHPARIFRCALSYERLY